jgi:hypothetical protein
MYERVKTKDRIRFETKVGADFSTNLYSGLCRLVRSAGLGPQEAFIEAAAPATNLRGRIILHESGEIPRSMSVERRDMYSPLDLMSLTLRKNLPVRLDLPAGDEELAENIRSYLLDPVGYRENND